jgi:hypothetical protein
MLSDIYSQQQQQSSNFTGLIPSIMSISFDEMLEREKDINSSSSPNQSRHNKSRRNSFANQNANQNIHQSRQTDNQDRYELESSYSAEKKPEWTNENEMLLVEMCDEAQCYKWLNNKAHNEYSWLHAWFTIPAIILSTFAGTASFAVNSLTEKYQHWAPIFIGSINIVISITATTQQYLRIAEKSEAHRVSSVGWDKYSRNIRVELGKSPEERTDSTQFLKVCRYEYDRLIETSPIIPEKIIAEFNRVFSGKPGSVERQHFDELKKPNICNVIISSSHSKFDRSKETNLHDKEKEYLMREMEKLKKNEIANSQIQKNEYEMTKKIKDEKRKIKAYIQHFKKVYEREPFPEEILENLKKREDISLETIENFIKEDIV